MEKILTWYLGIKPGTFLVPHGNRIESINAQLQSCAYKVVVTLQPESDWNSLEKPTLWF